VHFANKKGQKTPKSAGKRGRGGESGGRLWFFCQNRRGIKNGKLQRDWVEIVNFSVQGNKFGFIT
jgi:hypothetical protein